MKSLIVKIFHSAGKVLGINLVSQIREAAGSLIVVIYKATGAPLYRNALQQKGILRGTQFDRSGEKFLIEQIVLKHLNENESIIDVGANKGEYAKLLRNYFPANRIICFEPNPSAFEELRTNAQIEAVCKACGNINEQRILYFESGRNADTQASFSGKENIAKEKLDQVNVSCVRLEDEINQLKTEPIGFLKIDAEGHDFEVIQGLGQKIGDVKFIQFEFNEFHINTRTFIRDFHQLLSSTHDLFRIDRDGLHDLRVYHHQFEIFKYQNIVAVRKEITGSISNKIKRWS